MKYQLIYNEQRKITWVLILVPLMWSALFIGAILFLEGIPEWLILLSSVFLLVVSLLSVLLIIKKWLTIKCSIEITNDYFKYSMQKKSPFYSFQEIKISWDRVLNFNVDEINKSFYAVVTLSQPDMKFSLSPSSFEPKHIHEFREFETAMLQKISAYNIQAQEKHLHTISSKSFLENIWIRVLAIVFLIFLIAISIIFLLSKKDISSNYYWWRLIWIWFVSVPYLFLVIASWRKNK